MDGRNAKYNSDGSIDLEINHPLYGWIPFTARPDDEEDHGRAIHAAALAGDFGSIAAYVPPPPPDPPSIEELRENASLTRMQFFTALEGINLFDTVWAMQDDETVPKNVRIMLRTASSFDRMNPELVQMAAAMNFTDEQLDAVFGIE